MLPTSAPAGRAADAATAWCSPFRLFPALASRPGRPGPRVSR
jgi:hypothetical protein